MGRKSLVGQGLVIIEAVRSHSDAPQSLGLLWRHDQPDAETSTWQDTTLTTDRHPYPPPAAGFEPAIPRTERPQTHALDRAATGGGTKHLLTYLLTHSMVQSPS